jgi:DNA polymerase-1
MAKLQRTCPLLVVDGDSLAHRAYHALPKSIVLGGGRSGGAIVGFANFILRLYQSEQHRAVLVGWDTLDAPTYRHNALIRAGVTLIVNCSSNWSCCPGL